MDAAADATAPAFVSVPELRARWEAVPLAGVRGAAAVAAAAAAAFGMRGGAAELELRNCGPLRPGDAAADSVWAAAARLPRDVDGRALAGSFLVGRTPEWAVLGPAGRGIGRVGVAVGVAVGVGGDAPAAPATAPGPGPAVVVALAGSARAVPVRRCRSGWDLRCAVREAWRLPAADFGALELRCAGFPGRHDPGPGPDPDPANAAAWAAALPIADGDPFPDRERGLDWGCVLLGRVGGGPGPRSSAAA